MNELCVLVCPSPPPSLSLSLSLPQGYLSLTTAPSVVNELCVLVRPCPPTSRPSVLFIVDDRAPSGIRYTHSHVGRTQTTVFLPLAPEVRCSYEDTLGPKADRSRWITHVNHLGEKVGVDYVWYRNPGPQLKPMEPEWESIAYHVRRFCWWCCPPPFAVLCCAVGR